MRFDIPPATLARLRAHRAQHPGRVDPVTEREDAFILDPGFGPVVYLTSDGRVLIDGCDFWDHLPVHEASDDEAVAALVVGAKKTGIVELLELVPPPAPGSRTCTVCEGRGRRRYTPELEVICDCWGRGWILPSPA